MNAKAAAQAKVDAALSNLAPAIRDAFLDAIARHGASVDLGALVAALDRGDLYAAAATLEMPQAVLYPVTEAIRSGYIAAGAAVANDLPLYIRATFGFGQNPRAVAAVQRITAEFITNVVEAQREATREVIAALVNEGIPARQAALSIVGKINPLTGLREGGYLGLDVPRAQQAARVQAMLNDPAMIKNYFLPNGQPRYKTTDRRFDKTVRAAIANGKGLTKEQSEKITKAHRARLLKNRGDVVSRNEAMNALRKGEHDGWQAMVDSGAIDESRIERTWLSGRDGITRKDHVMMQGQMRRGMGTPFNFPDGHMAMYPGDHTLGADAGDLINCRCAQVVRLRRKNG